MTSSTAGEGEIFRFQKPHANSLKLLSAEANNSPSNQNGANRIGMRVTAGFAPIEAMHGVQVVNADQNADRLMPIYARNRLKTGQQ